MRVRSCLWVVALLFSHGAFSQTNRIPYNSQRLFLSGANLAWISFANDIGPGLTDFSTLGDILLQMHDHGGNAMRWWLHTNGAVTPAFNDTGLIIGPGIGTLEDLKKALDIAWEREIGVKLCLWSFDMLQSSNNPTVLTRNRSLLMDTMRTRAYINNSLVPMVQSLKSHPAIIAWEIFNEPEGMSDEFGWSDIQHVPMAAIQRFINLCAGAIHRTDSTALVTSGAWSFKALTDVPEGILHKIGPDLSQLSQPEKQQTASRFRQKYRSSLTADEITVHLRKVGILTNFNYYSDSRLIAAGGDAEGTLDFYSVHYYDWAGTPLSPFHHPAGVWGLDKPIVVAEFAMNDTYGASKENLYATLFQNGYAGALAWSWTDASFSKPEDMLDGMQYLWDNYRQAVDVLGISGDWPTVAITSPTQDSAFADGAQIPITALAYDKDGSIVLVEFFANDTLKIGERSILPYSLLWTNTASGFCKLTAIATDNQGHKRTSNTVQIRVGSPTMARLEAENALLSGTPVQRADGTASRGAYVAMQQTGTITWTLPSVPVAGGYEIVFGFRLSHDHPKTQLIKVNGVLAAEMVFDGAMNMWLEEKLTVNLIQGTNVIQMELSSGWMDLDYMAVPSSFVVSVADHSSQLPDGFSLYQNFPNPFNPNTVISYHLPATSGGEGSAVSNVRLTVFDILGREITTLVNELRPAGTHSVRWDASSFPSGVYFYRLEARNPTQSFIETRKMLLLK